MSFVAEHDELLSDRFKGFPFGRELRLADVPDQGWNLLAGDVPLPAAVLRRTELERNCAWMADYARANGVLLAPHVKTAMAPALMRRQLQLGAWGLTVANLHQLRTCRRLGAKRLFIANQVVGQCELQALVAELAADETLELYLLVDSAAGVELLEQACEAGGLARPLPVLVELGYEGGRAGCRTITGAASLARRVAQSKRLRLAGLEVYEGLHQSLAEAAGFAGVDRLLHEFRQLICELAPELPAARPIISAGGSAFYPEVVQQLKGLDCDLVLRSGCYVVHDHGLYERWLRQRERPRPAEGPRPALEVWTHVLSRPEPGLAILGAGKRDLGMDAGFPRPIARASAGGRALQPVADWEIVALSDQHAHVRIPVDAGAKVGDRVVLGVSHPCTTFDKWPLVYLVDDDYRIVEALRTCF